MEVIREGGHLRHYNIETEILARRCATRAM